MKHIPAPLAAIAKRIPAPLAAIVTAVVLAACQAPASASLQANTASYAVALDVDAVSLGLRTATVRISGDGPEPTRVTMTFDMIRMDHPGPTVEASKVDTGRYQASGEFFTMLGDWRVTVIVHGPSGDETASFIVTAEP